MGLSFSTSSSFSSRPASRSTPSSPVISRMVVATVEATSAVVEATASTGKAITRTVSNAIPILHSPSGSWTSRAASWTPSRAASWTPSSLGGGSPYDRDLVPDYTLELPDISNGINFFNRSSRPIWVLGTFGDRGISSVWFSVCLGSLQKKIVHVPQSKLDAIHTCAGGNLFIFGEDPAGFLNDWPLEPNTSINREPKLFDLSIADTLIVSFQINKNIESGGIYWTYRVNDTVMEVPVYICAPVKKRSEMFNVLKIYTVSNRVPWIYRQTPENFCYSRDGNRLDVVIHP